jgi:hypothetical protein
MGSSSYLRFKETGGVGMPLGGSLNSRPGNGNKGGDAGAEVEGTPVGGEAAVAALLHLLDHGGGGGTYLFCSGERDW